MRRRTQAALALVLFLGAWSLLQPHDMRRAVRNAAPAPTPAPQIAAPVPTPASLIAAPPTPCASGCTEHGNCNAALGRCDCPPMRSERACEHGAVPECRTQWGITLPTPPCQGLAEPIQDDFPPSCACLAACQTANLRVFYVRDCVNASLAPPPTDRFSDGKWLRQAYVYRPPRPGRTRAGATAPPPPPPPSASELSALNAALAARLESDGRRSVSQRLCSGNGIFTAPMPWRAPTYGEPPRCHCLPGWFGARCDRDSSHPAIASDLKLRCRAHCINNCSGRGVCRLNWCHCAAGYWGVDCSSGGAPPPPPSRQPARPLIYVYDLPPEFTTWSAAHYRACDWGEWDESWLYAVDHMLHRWIVSSDYYTADAEAADFFLLPVYLSPGNYDLEYGYYGLSGRGQDLVRRAVRYAASTWPWWNKTRGARHLLTLTNDKGALYLRGAVRELGQVTFITHWGWRRPHIHRPGVDVVVPPMLKVAQLIGESPYIHPERNARPGTEYRYLLSFVGSVRPHTPGYSFGVRQAVFARYANDTRFFLRDARGESKDGVQKALSQREYLSVMRDSKFCLAPAGMGFATRAAEAVSQGCVPLVIQHEPISNTTVEQPFEEVLDWGRFALTRRFEDIPHLDAILDAVPRATWLAMRAALPCVWPRLIWLRREVPPLPAPADGTTALAPPSRGGEGAAIGTHAHLVRHDAFETLMATLGRRAAGRHGGQLNAGPGAGQIDLHHGVPAAPGCDEAPHRVQR